jgi:predicted nucleic acid-binding protein
VTLVDTSSWVEALRRAGDVRVRERVRALLESGEAAWCELVRLELWNGTRAEAERRTLKRFEEDLRSLTITPEVWELSFDLARRIRGAGVTVPATDLLILACARHHQVPLEHCDAQFTLAEKALKGR